MRKMDLGSLASWVSVILTVIVGIVVIAMKFNDIEHLKRAVKRLQEDNKAIMGRILEIWKFLAGKGEK